MDPETKEEEEEKEEGTTDGAMRDGREVRRSKGYVAPFVRSFVRPPKNLWGHNVGAAAKLIYHSAAPPPLQ